MRVLPDNWQYSLAAFSISQVVSLVGLVVALQNGRSGTAVLVLIAILVLVGIVSFVAGIRRTLRLARGSIFRSSSSRSWSLSSYKSRWASTEEDIEEVHSFLADLMPADPPSLELMKQVHARSSHTVRIVEMIRNDSRRMVGALMLVPLTAHAVRDMEAGRLRNTSDAVLERHVCKTWRRPSAIYIGAIGGTTPAAKAWAMSLAEFIVSQSAVSTVYARPATNDGLRVLKGTGFKRLPSPSAFWVLRGGGHQ